jgi:hypothetical protein
VLWPIAVRVTVTSSTSGTDGERVLANARSDLTRRGFVVTAEGARLAASKQPTGVVMEGFMHVLDHANLTRRDHEWVLRLEARGAGRLLSGFAAFLLSSIAIGLAFDIPDLATFPVCLTAPLGVVVIVGVAAFARRRMRNGAERMLRHWVEGAA